MPSTPRQREIKRNWWRRHHKGTDMMERTTDYGKYEYRVVPNTWRSYVTARKEYTLADINEPLIQDLMAGKTLIVDYQVPHDSGNHPFRTLYNYFYCRRKKLRVHIIDDVANNQYRRLLMWAEPLVFKKAPVKEEKAA